jgi:hypothetical protein
MKIFTVRVNPSSGKIAWTNDDEIAVDGRPDRNDLTRKLPDDTSFSMLSVRKGDVFINNLWDLSGPFSLINLPSFQILIEANAGYGGEHPGVRYWQSDRKFFSLSTDPTWGLAVSNDGLLAVGGENRVEVWKIFR